MTEKHEKLRGVNLGGWLVLERWMTPSLFEGSKAQDEFTFMQEPDASEKVKWHRRTFIVEDDFRWLEANGVNAVRIPVGYWLFENDGPYTATVSYLDWAMQMAERYRLKVLIDLHGAKGSQNGKDHSGRIGKKEWFTNHTYRQSTLDLLKQIAKRYRGSPALWGIELLNEPQLGLVNYFILRRFYKQAYQEITKELRSGMHIVFSDAFAPPLFSGLIKARTDYPVALDVHWYQIRRANIGKYFKKLEKRSKEIARLQRQQPVIIGEWSGMLSHKTLKGHTEEEKKRLQERHIEKQLIAYESAAGWFYWTYKTEAPGIWNFRSLIEDGHLLLS